MWTVITADECLVNLFFKLAYFLFKKLNQNNNPWHFIINKQIKLVN